MSNDLVLNMTGMICTSCGAEVVEGNKFCSRCGTPVSKPVAEAASVSEPSVSAVSEPAASGTAAFDQAAGAPVSTVQTAPPPTAARQQVAAPSVAVADSDFIPSNKSKYQPISTGGYIGIWLLMMIPAVNLLLLIIWACGGCRKVGKRNLARSMLIIGAIFLVLGVILGFVFKNVLSSIFPFVSPYSSF